MAICGNQVMNPTEECRGNLKRALVHLDWKCKEIDQEIDPDKRINVWTLIGMIEEHH